MPYKMCVPIYASACVVLSSDVMSDEYRSHED